MLEWVCPQCDRMVDPAFATCPFCKNKEAEAGAQPPETKRGRADPSSQVVASGRALNWALADRVFRYFLGALAVLALIYFLAFLWAYSNNDDVLLGRLARVLFWR